jgi:hypothetical protein
MKWFSRKPNEEKEYFVCQACRGFFFKTAKHTVVSSYGSSTKEERHHYCKACKPSYDHIQVGIDDRYFRKVEVAKDGTPIGYQPIKAKGAK